MASWLSLAALGCSSAADYEAASGVADGDGADPSDDDPWAEDEGGGSAGSDEDDGADAARLDLGGGQEPPPDPGGEFDDCPAALPQAWVLCEDFESIADPAEVALDYQSLDGAFTLVDDVGASGHSSMEVQYRPKEEAAGRMVLSFGISPLDHGERPGHASDQTFDEIYWRLRVMTEPGWPDEGPGQLTRTISFADESWAEAVVAHLRSVEGDVTTEAVPVTCINGADVMCTGFDDQGNLESLGTLAGDAPLWSESMSGQWHCVEGHLRLNTPGQADGVLEFWIDGERQAGREDLDLRGSWDAYGINALVLDNHWPGGAPKALRRWIDDVVVSSAPIGCDQNPDDATPGG